ncbi:MAG: phosphopantothenoylcysteine decarboxylase [Sedimentisphaerales bacterium]|nr:phosphopantothenoylcysteine decarboxylase [Sedimentisphaerales bacterium]MBN2841483.1 phosphopantothenoylcysteine decarboxylase [Sedimentisphaerales bacterium]
MRILITAGPTREYIDPVRYITNGSTGQMGYACALQAVARGHRVTLISGPVHLPRPDGVKFISVVSAADMAKAVLHEFSDIDCVIMTAAVADYTPAVISDHKIVKMPGDMQLHMIRTMDILAKLGQIKNNSQKLIGFALQDENARENASRKLQEKNLDAIVLNDVSALGEKNNTIQILRRHSQNWQIIENMPKSELGITIIDLAESLCD